jgi:hypothetical protein
MVKLVDTRDLKSLGEIHLGSNPGARTNKKMNYQPHLLGFNPEEDWLLVNKPSWHDWIKNYCDDPCWNIIWYINWEECRLAAAVGRFFTYLEPLGISSNRMAFDKLSPVVFSRDKRADKNSLSSNG